MNDFDHTNHWDDNQLEIIDLDPPSHMPPLLSLALKLAHKIYPAHTRITTLTSLLAIAALMFLVQPAPLSTTYLSNSATTQPTSATSSAIIRKCTNLPANITIPAQETVQAVSSSSSEPITNMNGSRIIWVSDTSTPTSQHTSINVMPSCTTFIIDEPITPTPTHTQK